jgi:glycosyltransferase involved in cell wall biosynthesis
MSIPKVSVITALKDPDMLFLDEAYSSLLKQKVSWEWLIQIDGPIVNLPGIIKRDKRVIIEANGKAYGPAITRNRALTRSRASFVQNLDADDYLLPGALDAMFMQIQTNKYAFVFGRDVSIELDGSTHGYAGGLDYGVILPGVIYKRWQDIHMPPVHPAGIMWRREVLLNYGGWQALSSGEDTSIMLVTSFEHPVYFLDLDTFMYRLHHKQATSKDEYGDSKDANHNFINQRIDALSSGIKLTSI